LPFGVVESYENKMVNGWPVDDTEGSIKSTLNAQVEIYVPPNVITVVEK
jgi:hypothetical protein